MNQSTDAISFIRNHLKYTTTKKYVGAISAGAINRLWRTVNQTEYNGIPFKFYCGYIDINILRNAFLHELSYNPLRFKTVSLNDMDRHPKEVGTIIDSIYRILRRFSALWPNGIHGHVDILDVADQNYIFLRDLRNCFKEITRQNIADLKRTQYRDEIVARFATANDINMTDDMRATLHEMAKASASRRAITALTEQISALDKQIKAHAHDRELCFEMQNEQKRLNELLDAAIATEKSKSTNRRGRVTAPHIDIYDDAPENTAAEREEELLTSMTTEHQTDEIFQDYVEQTVGLRLYKYRGEHQH